MEKWRSKQQLASRLPEKGGNLEVVTDQLLFGVKFMEVLLFVGVKNHGKKEMRAATGDPGGSTNTRKR